MKLTEKASRLNCKAQINYAETIIKRAQETKQEIGMPSPKRPLSSPTSHFHGQFFKYGKSKNFIKNVFPMWQEC